MRSCTHWKGIPRRDWREGGSGLMEGHCRDSPLTQVNSELLFCPRAIVEDRLFLPEGLRCPSDSLKNLCRDGL